ncbi:MULTISPECIES: SIR2 family protein [unclassified Acinetobacter]|uniref:SIR2 family NAD-dependent protein deacylase n=1 Tax=unclassified Acinetobacter TaxID=196816 RepID=UPI002574B62C|nr:MULTISPECIES: SIR2 family protein [unclassified Acinetobacter]MDM1762776.1 SIR2 family protein [Acinetobacter sp. 226-1]MDM1766255.1 SIR2 family protein [Acinetobacter sp. 226-4]
MSIPDQSHINHIRELLWNTRNGGASVMVGAGFSRNALPVSASAKEFPLWSQVAQNLCRKLYPESEKSRLNQALSEATGTSGFLRLAQEYEIAFGRGSLHNFISDSVPDLDYRPSELHHQLLELPWKEVLTTNWDTLLERAQLEIPERSYNIVRTVDELANTPSPRIIKLHGTVPSHIPFIFTEEDYRTYPKKFAPLVNTVQQIMMETAVLLIGFSGDDPNFLQWSGWVRDNLGISSPKIYLAGWLNLAPHRRRMLENNNVVPIDVSNHPKAHEWPEHLRHQYATEWIIQTLQCGQSYDFKDWPSLHNYYQPEVKDYLHPIEPNSQCLPLRKTRIGMSDPISIETLQEVLSIWEHNRKIYPNWIVFPLNLQHTLDQSLNEWSEEIIKNFDNFSVDEQLRFLKEIIWLYQKKLVPIPTNIKSIWDDISEKFNFKNKMVNDLDHSSNWPKFKQIYIENSLYSLINERLSLNENSFKNKLEKLKQFSNHSIEIKNNVIYEECQWCLLNLDFKNLEEILQKWHVFDCDPIWMFRKSALLLELNFDDEANNLISLGYSIIKKNPDKFNDFSNSSREAWALSSIQALIEGKNSSSHIKIKKFNIDERLKQLELVNCNSNKQISFLIEKVNQRKDKENNLKNPCFDLYRRRGETIKFNNYKYEAINHAYQCLLLCETAGLPLSLNNFSIGISLITTLIENYDLIDKNIAQRIVVRLKPSDDDKYINTIYSRVDIASLSEEDFKKLLSQIEILLTYSLDRYKKNQNLFWVSYIRTCLELLSRLVLRLNNIESLEHHLKNSIHLFQDLSLRKASWLQRPLSNYLKRCWEACNSKIKSIYILKILQLPINGIEISRNENLIRIDQLISTSEVKELCVRNVSNENDWNIIINSILSSLKINSEPRWDACIRLTLISNFIKDHEYEKINKLLWQDKTSSKDDFPLDTNLYDFVYSNNLIKLDINSNEIFSKKYFIESNDFNDLKRILFEVSNSVDKIKLTIEQKNSVIVNIENWINSIPENKIKLDGISRAFNNTPNEIVETLSDVKVILETIEIPRHLAELLFYKIQYLQQYEIYSYHLVCMLAKSLPDKINDINTLLRKGLISESPNNSKHAMYGLFLWIQQATKDSSSTPYPSDDLIREIGLSIAMRRKNHLIQALLAATSIFKANDSHPKEIINSFVLEGLEYLILESNYHESSQNIEDIPIVRLNCLKLANQMFMNGYHNELIIQKWLEEGKNDPLPEVRNSIIESEADTDE